MATYAIGDGPYVDLGYLRETVNKEDLHNDSGCDWEAGECDK